MLLKAKMEMVSILEIPETQLTSIFHTHSKCEWIVALKHHEYYNASLGFHTGEFEVSIIMGYSAASLHDWRSMSWDSVLLSSSTVQISTAEIAWEYSTLIRNTTTLRQNVGHQLQMMWHHIPVEWRPEIS
jgi:hypothetical protein